MVVHVDQAALANGEGRAGLPIETVRRLSCDSDRIILIEDERSEPLSIGRKSRVVPHAIHWSNGGETSLECLLLLCSEHHPMVHEGGFRLERDYLGCWFFKPPDGRAVPACGYRAADMTDDDGESGEYLDADASAEASVVGEQVPDACRLRGASVEASVVREPPPENYRVLHASAEHWAAAA